MSTCLGIACVMMIHRTAINSKDKILWLITSHPLVDETIHTHWINTKILFLWIINVYRFAVERAMLPRNSVFLAHVATWNNKISKILYLTLTIVNIIVIITILLKQTSQYARRQFLLSKNSLTFIHDHYVPLCTFTHISCQAKLTAVFIACTHTI